VNRLSIRKELINAREVLSFAHIIKVFYILKEQVTHQLGGLFSSFLLSDLLFSLLLDSPDVSFWQAVVFYQFSHG
jgi:hypothetical protein